MQLIIQLGVILTNPKNNNNSGDNNTNSLFKITKEINNMKEEIKKTNNNLMKYLPKKAIEDKINLINDNRSQLLKKIETNEEKIKQNKKEMKNINKLIVRLEEELKENKEKEFVMKIVMVVRFSDDLFHPITDLLCDLKENLFEYINKMFEAKNEKEDEKPVKNFI